MSPRQRAVLAIYGLTVAVIFVWVPWCGYDVPKERGNATNLGYGAVWSPPRPPAAFVQYDQAAKYEFAPPPIPSVAPSNPGPSETWRDGLLTKYPPMPRDYISPFAYKAATIDYRRVGLEFGALTAMLSVVWLFTAPFGRIARGRQTSVAPHD